MLSLHDKFQLGYLRSDSEFYKYMACYLVGGLPIATHPLSATMPLTNKSETFALEGSKGLGTMTYAERKTYRWEVLHLPGPVDRWLVANIRSPRINFLQHYLMSKDGYGYVTCFVEIESEEVRFFVIQIYQRVSLIYYLAPKHESPCTKVDYVYTLYQGHCLTSIENKPLFEDEPSCHLGTIYRLKYRN
jgi:hypothetical protein